MKDEYDFRGAERGKFYRPGAQIHYRDHEGRIVHRGHPVTEPCSIPGCDGGCPSVGCDATSSRGGDATPNAGGVSEASPESLAIFVPTGRNLLIRREETDASPIDEARPRDERGAWWATVVALGRQVDPASRDFPIAPGVRVALRQYSGFIVQSSVVDGTRTEMIVVEADQVLAVDARDVQDWRTRARATPASLPLRRLRSFARDGSGYDPRGPLVAEVLARLRGYVEAGLDAYGQGDPGDPETRANLESLAFAWHSVDSPAGALARDVAVLLVSLEHNARRVVQSSATDAPASPRPNRARSGVDAPTFDLTTIRGRDASTVGILYGRLVRLRDGSWVVPYEPAPGGLRCVVLGSPPRRQITICREEAETVVEVEDLAGEAKAT